VVDPARLRELYETTYFKDYAGTSTKLAKEAAQVVQQSIITRGKLDVDYTAYNKIVRSEFRLYQSILGLQLDTASRGIRSKA